MAIVRGQWYQWKAHPDQFYRASVVTSTYVQLYPFDSTKYPPMFVTPAYVQANFRLLSYTPQYMLLDGLAPGKTSITRANLVEAPVVWGSVTGNSSVSQSHALLDTTLRGKVNQFVQVTKSILYLSQMQTRGSVLASNYAIGNFTPAPHLAGHVNALSTTKGSDFTVYPLGGHLASRGSVVQAHAS